jgi:hypothetical protein
VPVTTERHANGLAITIPTRFELSRLGLQPVAIDRTPSGFKVTVARELRLRHPSTATVDLLAGVPSGDWPEQRTVHRRVVRYRIDNNYTNGDGSYTFSAWVRCPVGYVLWQQTDAGDWEPSFELAWALIAGTEPPG